MIPESHARVSWNTTPTSSILLVKQPQPETRTGFVLNREKTEGNDVTCVLHRASPIL